MRSVKKALCLILVMTLLVSVMGITAFADSCSAVPFSSPLLIDGVSVSMQAYNINGHNYFKLRDIAMALNGSAKQFDLAYDSSLNAIMVSTGLSYTPVGGECSISGDTGAKTAVATSSSIYVDNNETGLTAYNIGGYNYFMIRALAAKIDFGISYDIGKNSIAVNTSTGYTSDGSEARTISGNWAQFHSDYTGSFSYGFSFDSSGKFYNFSTKYGDYNYSNGQGSTGGLAVGVDAGPNLTDYFTVKTSGSQQILKLGTYSFTKTDSSSGIFGTWSYTGGIGDGLGIINLRFLADQLDVDTYIQAATYTVSGDTISFVNNDGSCDSWIYSVTTENGHQVFHHGAQAYS